MHISLPQSFTRHLKPPLFLGPILFAVCTNHALANDRGSFKTTDVAADQSWLALLHYESSSGHQFHSRADNDNFFLSHEGKNNPEKELQVLSKVLHEKNDQYKDVLCRFPARAKWLRGKLQQAEDDFSHCNDYLSWRQKYPKSKLSIVYTSLAANSPASLMGHTFLKFSDDSRNDLLSMSTNFVANTQTTTGPIGYIYKGITGGFPNTISEDEMFRMYRRYSVDEARDMWEYTLDFSEHEISLLIDHLWEMKNTTFMYYFFSENCSYQALAALRVVKPNQININKFKRKTIPIDALRELEKNKLLTSISYKPSSQLLFLEKTSTLSRNEKGLIHNITHSKVKIKEIDFSQYKTSKQTLLTLAHRYTSIAIETRKIKSHIGQEVIYSLNQELAKEESNIAPAREISRQNDPLKSHRSQRLTIATGNIRSPFIDLGYRFAGHNYYDPYSKHLNDIQADYLNVLIRASKEGSVEIEKLSLFNVNSTPNYSSFFPRKSWGVELEASRQLTGKNRDLLAKLSVNLGINHVFSNHQIGIFAASGVETQIEKSSDLLISYGGQMSFKSNFDKYNYKISHKFKRYTSNIIGESNLTSVNTSLNLNSNLRLYSSYVIESMNEYEIKTFAIGFNHYY